MKLRSVTLIVFLALLIHSSALFAQWVKTNGPCGRGGEILSICVKGSDIFAGTNTGLYLSKDEGKSWFNVTPVVSHDESYNSTCFALAVEGQYLIAAMGAGVYITSDDGVTWIAAGEGLSQSSVVSKMVVSGSKVIGATPYLYETTDSGLHWSWIDSSRVNVVSLVAQDSLVFAGAFTGVLRSTDYGTTWTQVYSTNVAPVLGLVISGDRVFAGIAGSVIGSTDDGVTWNADSSALKCTVVNSLLTSPPGSCNNFLFAGTDSGVFRSSDNGATWASKGPLNTSHLIFTLAFKTNAETGAGVLLAGTGAGIFSSSDCGDTWAATGVPPGTWYLAAFGSDVVAGSTTPPYVSLGAGSGVTLGNDDRCEVYRTNDFGLTWSEADQGLNDHQHSILTSLAASPYAAGGFKLFAGATSSYEAGQASVFASSDVGATWVNVIPDSLGGASPAVFAGNANIFIGTTGYGMFRSTDYGATWTAHDSGMSVPPSNGYTQSCVNAFSLDGSRLYAAGGYGVFFRGHGTYHNYIMVSTDDGSSWSPVDSGFTPRATAGTIYDTISVLKCIYASGSHLLVGMQAWNYGMSSGAYPLTPTGGGIYHIVNTGGSWTIRDSSLMGEQIFSIVAKDRYIFASAIGSGVFRSTDEGTTWENIGAGLTDSSVTGLLVADPYLFAATASGVWRRPLSEITSAGREAPGATIPTSYSLSQNYPNPFNPSTIIRYELPRNAFVTLEVYDVLGRRVQTLVNERENAGAHSVILNGNNLASGMYFCRMHAENFTEARKFLLLK